MDANTPMHYEYPATSLEARANPILKQTGLILFDQIQPHHFMPALQQLINIVEPQLQKIENTSTASWKTVMEPLEHIEEKIARTMGPMVHLTSVTDSKEIREAWLEVEPLYTQLELRIQQSPSLYAAFETIKTGKEWYTLSPTQKRILTQRLREARLRGVNLSQADQETFNALVKQLNTLQTTYVSNIRDATNKFTLIVNDKEQVAGIPYPILKLTSESYNLTRQEENPPSTPEKGPWKFSLSRPIYTAVMRHSHHRSLRETLYRAQMQKASQGMEDNCGNIKTQLHVRHAIAQLLGFDSFADLSLATKMAPDVDTVHNFLENLRTASWASGREELLKVQLFAAQKGFREPFMPWDFAYWSECLKEENFHLSEKELKLYFPFPRVLKGLFDLCNQLFGIEIVPADFKVPVWHHDVGYYLVKDAQGNPIGSFYLDPYTRESKRGGAWTDTCQNRMRVGENLQLPIAYIVCNGTPPSHNAPSLLAFQEVVTLFHEFGHALQHLLTRVDYASASGTNGVEWDAVEIPSKFMENWCYHKPTLQKITGHYQTDAPLPEVLIDKIISTRTFNAGSTMLAQLKYSLCDLVLHRESNPDTSPFDTWYTISLATSHLPCLQEDRFLCSFHHVFGGNAYAAGYYSYKWAEVLSADAFQAFQEIDNEDPKRLRELGEKFKTTFLELGGSMHPSEVFTLFRGRAPSIEALLEQNGLKQP